MFTQISAINQLKVSSLLLVFVMAGCSPSAPPGNTTRPSATPTPIQTVLPGKPSPVPVATTIPIASATPNNNSPTVTFTSPVNAEIGVAVNRKIVTTFSEVMDPGTLNNSSFTLTAVGQTPVAGTVTYVGNVATFTPNSNLATNTTYTATITTEAKALNGKALALKKIWIFTTGSSNDTTPPKDSYANPDNGANSVATNGRLNVTFSEIMDPVSLNTSTFTLKEKTGLKAVPGKVTYIGNIATFTPDDPLTANTTYIETLTTGIKDLAGNPLAAERSWTFTTGSSGGGGGGSSGGGGGGGGGGGVIVMPDIIAPTMSSTNPANISTAVPINGKIAVNFSEVMNPGTVNTTTFTLQGPGGVAVAGAVTYIGTIANFTPTSNLAANTTYTATVTTGVKDLAGNPLGSNTSWTFSTGAAADIIAPTVSSTSPANAASGVALNTQITSTFSEVIDPFTINSQTFTLTSPGGTPVSGAVTYTGTTATFTPTSTLIANTLYTATITTGIKDLAGNVLNVNKSWTFTTGNVPDTTAPTVSSTTPANAAGTVSLNSQIAATLSEAMDPASLNTAVFTLMGPGATPVSGAVTYAGTTATFTPTSSLMANTLYTATLTTGAKDLAGNALALNKTWSFTTGNAADTTPPTVSSTTPANASTAVVLNSQIASTFGEAMDPLTLTTATYTVTGPGATPVSGTVTYAGNIATFTPTSNFTANTTYTATITTGAKDIAGNALALNKVWTFTTGAASDTTAPTVLSSNPLNLGNSVAVNSPIDTTFSEPLDPLTVTTASYTVSAPGPVPVSGTVSFAGNVATFTPTSTLARNTTYTGTISTAVRDLAGNTLAVNKVWTFTTALGPAPVSLGTAGDFAILAKSGISTVPTSAIKGDIGVSPIDLAAITGFSTIMDASNTFATSSQVTGKIYAANLTPPTPTKMTTAVGDMELAYTDAAGRPTPDFINLGAGEIGGQTLVPGLYKWGTGVSISTNVTLAGGPNDVWIFQVAGDITQASTNITLTGGALPKNIFWQTFGAVNLAANAHFEGIVLCKTGINLGANASANSRLLSQTAVTLQSNAVTQPAP